MAERELRINCATGMGYLNADNLVESHIGCIRISTADGSLEITPSQNPDLFFDARSHRLIVSRRSPCGGEVYQVINFSDILGVTSYSNHESQEELSK